MTDDRPGMSAGEQCYRALKLTPCACRKIWLHGHAEMQTIQRCGRCKAISRFEREHPEVTADTE
jgi:hypothetical protein